MADISDTACDLSAPRIFQARRTGAIDTKAKTIVSLQRQRRPGMNPDLLSVERERAYGATGNHTALACSAERNTDWVALA